MWVLLTNRPADDFMTKRAGLTLIELLVASMVVALLAGAMLIAFLTAAKISSQSNQNTEAAYLAQQTVERFRNQVACDNTADVSGAQGDPTKRHWFDAGTCKSAANFSNTADPDPDPNHTYTVEAQDCDNEDHDDNLATGVADCFKVTATVYWDPPR